MVFALEADTKVFGQIAERIAKLRAVSGKTVEVGWPEGTPQEILLRAWATEFRADPFILLAAGVPGRSINLPTGPAYMGWAALRKTGLEAKAGAASELAGQINTGKPAQEALDAVGEEFVSRLRENIEGVQNPALRKATVARKRAEGAPRPEKVWVETGATVAAARHRVVDSQ